MWKIFKSRKALSPVVAAIILIAVTVAVSIAVAAWMGALTFTFMRTEEVKITSIQWATGNANATLTLKNSGTSSLTIDTLKINSVTGELYRWRTVGGTWAALPATGLTFEPGQVYEVCVRRSGASLFTPGTKYEFVFHTAAGNNYPYTDYAP